MANIINLDRVAKGYGAAGQLLTDVSLGLDDDARMNVPGVAEGNWSWRADGDDVAAAAEHLADLVRESGR